MDFSTIKDVISFIFQLCAGPISHIHELEENLNTLGISMDQLKELRNDVRRRVETEEAKGMRRIDQIDGWLRRTNDMETQVEGILTEGSEDITSRCLGGFCPKNCYASFKLGEQVVRKIKDVDDLKGQGRGFEIVAEALPPPPVQEMPAAPTTGMDLMFEKAWSRISKEQAGIMGIYGIGGVGKTTLLKRINNEFMSSQTLHFDVVIWVVVSKEVNAKKIQDDVAKRLGLSLSKDESLDDRAVKLHSELSKKTFVLLLDDIWEPVDLTAIGIPCPNIKNKSKVLFATRSEDVCGQMKAQKIKVECLDSAEAWKLFQKEVGVEALDSHPEIPVIAKQVAEECGGLPLALIITSRAMVSMKTPQEWRHQLKILKKSASEFPGMEEKVYSILKFSYDRLLDDNVKSCFLYCSLFPEDHSIEIKDLILYWIWEGFLDEFEDMDEAENKGYAIIGILKRACLLESGLDSPTEEVKMHDVLRDLALWIGGDNGRKKNKLLVRAGMCLTEAPEVGKWREAEKISLMYNEIEKLEDEAPECPSLLTLIISQNYGLSNISNGFFQHMRVLRVLDLSDTSINVLPTSIGELIELEYLGLARTYITELPREIKSLVKLKCLDLRSTVKLKFIPCGILSSFSRLQVLDLTRSKFEHWEVENGDIGQDDENVGASIEELGCLRDLQYLSINITNVASLNRILASEKLARCTRRLSVTKCQQLTPVILKHRSLSNIRHIEIHDCELKDLSWLHGFENIEILKVRDCKSLKAICDGINLKMLEVRDCEGLQKICDGTDGVPNLKRLEVRDCKGLQQICGDNGGCFPNLAYIYIIGCNELKDISWLQGARSLSVLNLHDCKGLQQICDGAAGCFPNLSHIRIIGCNALKDLSILLHGSTNLRTLVVHDYKGLICDGITGGFFPNLCEVYLLGCNALKDLSWLRGSPILETLEVVNCKGLERIICDVEDAEGKESPVRIFSGLSELRLVNLPELKSIPWQTLSSDTKIEMEDCPKATPSNEHNIRRF